MVNNFIDRFGKRVSRAFSISKTPRSMKRAISSVTHIMSPLRRESSVFGLPSIAPSTPVGNSERHIISSVPSFDGSDADVTVSCVVFYFYDVNKRWLLKKHYIVPFRRIALKMIVTPQK